MTDFNFLELFEWEWYFLCIIQHLKFTKLVTGQLADNRDNFVDGAVIAAARTLPTWSDGDVPPIPSMERKAVKELQEECQQMLAQFPTTSGQDQKLLGEHGWMELTSFLLDPY